LILYYKADYKELNSTTMIGQPDRILDSNQYDWLANNKAYLKCNRD